MNLRSFVSIFILSGFTTPIFAQFAPPAGEVGTTAIHKDSSAIVAWATEVVAFERGLEDIVYPEGPLASFGESDQALGYAEGTSVDVVSLGDYGVITLGFDFAIQNGEGADFAVFENSFSDLYLEFAHVEVSTDGEHFVRFPSVSYLQTDEQTGTYANSDPTKVHNLAGKYRQAYGTPFDLEDLVDSSGIDLMEINFVRIIDVVGSIDPAYGTYDSEGNLINDPYPTDFESGGFDLDGVGVIHNSDPTASVEVGEEVEFSVYPNPTNGLLTISVNGEVEWIRVINLTGQEIAKFYHEKQIFMNEIGVASGIYLLEITLLNGTVLRKEVVYQ